MIDYKIIKTSNLTGKTNTMIIRLDIQDINSWKDGMLIQNALPYLTSEEREFLITGATPEEWDDTFKEEEA